MTHHLATLLPQAQSSGYAVGSFSPRYTPVIRPVLQAAQRFCSPLIVQISEKELERGGITLIEFAEEFRRQVASLRPTVPICLHLDHTRSFQVIREAVEAGFSSVMIDASALPFEENMALTAQVVEYAHARGVSVEAELGRIGDAGLVETDTDEELFTDPQEAARFVRETGVDALAVSVGTAHGVYTVRQPRIDLLRLAAIRALTPVPLVLHGGSGTPARLIHQAVSLPGGGISKINFATDLELALLVALRMERVPNVVLKSLQIARLAPALAAVQAVVEDKILNFLGSSYRA